MALPVERIKIIKKYVNIYGYLFCTLIDFDTDDALEFNTNGFSVYKDISPAFLICKTGFDSHNAHDMTAAQNRAVYIGESVEKDGFYVGTIHIPSYINDGTMWHSLKRILNDLGYKSLVPTDELNPIGLVVCAIDEENMNKAINNIKNYTQTN